jgi:hypothetical protein
MGDISMTLKLLTEVLNELTPAASWAAEGDTYDTVTWFSDDVEKPKKEIVEAEIKKRQAVLAALEYQRLRKPEYPPMADLADAIYWQSQGDESKMQAYLAVVNQVKQKYPKS